MGPGGQHVVAVARVGHRTAVGRDRDDAVVVRREFLPDAQHDVADPEGSGQPHEGPRTVLGGTGEDGVGDQEHEEAEGDA